MNSETINDLSGMYWVKLSNNAFGHTVYFAFGNQDNFHAWYNGVGENCSHRAEYTPLELNVDMRERFQ